MTRSIKSISVVKVNLNDMMIPDPKGTPGFGVRIEMSNGGVRYNECSFCSRNFEKQFASIEKEAKRLAKHFKVDYVVAI